MLNSSAKDMLEKVAATAMRDAVEAVELMDTLDRSDMPADLLELLEDAYTVAAAAQKILASGKIDQYTVEESMVILTMEAIEIARQEVKAASMVSVTRGLLH